MNLPEIKSVAVCAPNWVGDVVMATPAFRALRESMPHAEITLVVRAYAIQVLNGAPWFDRVFRIEGNPRSAIAMLRTAKALRSSPADLAVVFPNSFRSALAAWLGGSRIRIGYGRDMRSAILTRAVKRPSRDGRFEPRYMVDYYLDLVADLGVQAESRKIELFVTPEEEEAWADLRKRLGLDGKGGLAGINPGAAWGSSKCWPPERFAEAADLIAGGTGARIIVLAGPGEERVQKAIVSAMRSPAIAPASKDVPLGLLKPLVRDLSLLVTNDTGPRHFANAFRTPSVVVMGPTDPRYTSDPAENAVVLRSNRDCMPCHLKKCPHRHECMLDVTAGMVADAAAGIMKA